jgi:hypothetical protein
MPQTVSANYIVLLSDDVVEVGSAQSTNITITLPTLADASGRSYRVVKKNDTAHTVTVNNSAGTSQKVFATTDKFVGETFTASCNADKSVCSWVQSNAAGIVPKTSNYATTTSDSVIHVDTTAGNITVTLYTQVGNAGKKLRIANINGANNVSVAAASGQTIFNSAGSSVSAVTVAPGRSVNLIVTNTPQWKDQAADIQTVTSSATVAAGKTVVNADATSGNITITLPAAADRFGKSTIGPLVFVSKVDSSANTVTANGVTLTAPGTMSFRTNGTTWVNTAAAKTEATQSGAGSSTTDLDGTKQVHKLTHNGAKNFRLPASATQLIEINNTGTGDATIYAAANKKLFTSGGYVPSVTIVTGRSSAFSYSAGLNAWVKV